MGTANLNIIYINIPIRRSGRTSKKIWRRKTREKNRHRRNKSAKET
jgi:hypothetical protein